MNAQMPNANGYEQHCNVAGNAPPVLLLWPVFVVPSSLAPTDVQLQLVSQLLSREASGVATPTTCRVSRCSGLILSFCAGGSWHPVTWKITNMSERRAEVALRRIRR